MSDQHIQFEVEEIPRDEYDAEGIPHYRATLSGDYTTWGYGETVWEAIAAVCELYEDEQVES